MIFSYYFEPNKFSVSSQFISKGLQGFGDYKVCEDVEAIEDEGALEDTEDLQKIVEMKRNLKMTHQEL